MHQYKDQKPGWEVRMKCASFPGNVAYDTPNGGIFTSYISKSVDEEITQKMYWSIAGLRNHTLTVRSCLAQNKRNKMLE